MFLPKRKMATKCLLRARVLEITSETRFAGRGACGYGHPGAGEAGNPKYSNVAHIPGMDGKGRPRRRDGHSGGLSRNVASMAREKPRGILVENFNAFGPT